MSAPSLNGTNCAGGGSAATPPCDTLMIDNYDSFTYNLVQYLEQLGTRVTTLRNDQVTGSWMCLVAAGDR